MNVISPMAGSIFSFQQGNFSLFIIRIMAKYVQLKIDANHQNGKDSHIRQVQLLGE
jgi:hypothetical protein